MLLFPQVYTVYTLLLETAIDIMKEKKKTKKKQIEAIFFFSFYIDIQAFM